MSETVVQSTLHYTGRILNFRLDTCRLANGETVVREVVEHRPAVAMVAVDAQGYTYLVRQFRAGVAGETLEIPAGTMDGDEAPETCAARELQEEIGMAAGRWERLGGYYVVPGYSTEFLHFFLATDLRPSRLAHDFDESIAVERLPLAEALRRVQEAGVTDMKTVLGLLLAVGRLQGADGRGQIADG